jgi:uncharacterized damage-inducible protein DinB
MKSVKNTEVGRLADQLERSFHGGAWHGPATREALTGIDAATASRRPDGSPHAIVEIVRHITFWLNADNLRIFEGRDVDLQSDWPEEGELTDEAWIRAIAELEQAHAKLHTSFLDLDDERLDDAVPDSDATVRGMLLGTLQHNAYHTGQIVHLAQELAK